MKSKIILSFLSSFMAGVLAVEIYKPEPNVEYIFFFTLIAVFTELLSIQLKHH